MPQSRDERGAAMPGAASRDERGRRCLAPRSRVGTGRRISTPMALGEAGGAELMPVASSNRRAETRAAPCSGRRWCSGPAVSGAGDGRGPWSRRIAADCGSGANPARFRGMAPWESSPRARQRETRACYVGKGPERGPRPLHGMPVEVARKRTDLCPHARTPRVGESGHFRRIPKIRKIREVRGEFRRVGAFGPRRDPWWVR